MADQGWYLAKQAEIEAIKAEIAAMNAANWMRERRGEALAYAEDAFMEKAKALYGLHDQIMLAR
jgi:hypothetical protein